MALGAFTDLRPLGPAPGMPRRQRVQYGRSIGIRNEGMMLSFGSGGSVTELSVTDCCRDWCGDGKILSPQKQNCLPSTGLKCEMATKVETCQYLTSDRDIHNREVRR
jgi:hypothetical protein